MWPARSRSRKFSRLLENLVPNQVNQSLLIWVQKPFLPAWRAPVSSTDTNREVSSPARKTSRASLAKSSWFSVRRRCNRRFEIDTPTDRTKVNRRDGLDCP